MGNEKLTLSTGITVGIRKVAPHTLDLVRRHYPPPVPPMVAVDYDGKIVQEANDADPDHQQALKDHQALLSEKIIDAMFQLGVDVQVDPAAVAAFKEEMAALDIDVPGNDKQVYIRHIAVGTKEDLEALSRAITRTTMPTEEAVSEHLATFSGDIPGATGDGHKPAPVGP